MPQWAIWAPVLAAIGASLLTGSLAVGLDLLRRRADRDDARHGHRREAYLDFLSRSADVIFVAGSIRLTMQLRSGLSEGINVTTRQLKALDPWEFMRELRDEVTGPLNHAWSQVWLFGTGQSIQAANKVMAMTGEVLGTASRTGTARSGFARWLHGVKWTADEETAFNASLRDFAVARKQFADIARHELGSEVVDLFAATAT